MLTATQQQERDAMIERMTADRCGWREIRDAIAAAGWGTWTRVVLQRRMSGIRESLREQRAWGQMSDEQIVAWQQAATEQAVAALAAAGATIVRPEGSSSVYATMPSGRRVRISDHRLPATAERDALAAQDLGHSLDLQLVFDRHLSEADLAAKIAALFEE